MCGSVWVAVGVCGYEVRLCVGEFVGVFVGGVCGWLWEYVVMR